MKESKKKILVFRLSALGDVAMTVPVIKALLEEHPNIAVTFVSKGFTQPLFENLDGVTFFRVDDKKRHAGFLGIFRLYSDLRRLEDWDAIADLHDVLRTKLIRLLFTFSKAKTAVIDKGRKEKRALTRKRNKRFVPLKHTVERYCEVFFNIGFPVKTVNQFNSIFTSKPILQNTEGLLSLPKDKTWIGIAPFAKHKGKAYPLEYIKEVIAQLSSHNQVNLLLFGGRGEEQREIELLAQGKSNIYPLAGKLAMNQELEIMAHLDVMISMDSANMHLATLSGTRVLSIWGATHPFAGFLGWNQSAEDAIQIELYCRPCSVFGNKPCYRGDYACLYEISPQMVVDAVWKALKLEV